MTSQDGSRMIDSVDTTCRIIGELQDQNGGTISELDEGVNVSSATIHAHLATLKKQGLVRQEGQTYELGPRLLTLGEHVRNNSTLFKASKEQVESLAEETGECAHLIVQHGGKLYALYERFGDNAVGIEFHDRKRERPLSHLHCTAAGKAILAHIPEEEVTRILDTQGLPQRTSNTITNREALYDDLERVRERGYAVVDEEQMNGIRAVGVPVTSPTDTVVGALAVSGPTTRLQGELFDEELPDELMRSANVCEVDLQTRTMSGEL